MAQKKDISSIKKGMQKDRHPSQLEQQEYIFALNANLSDESGNLINITNEHSNILSSKFKDGYKVVGFKNDINSNNTYFFLTNPTTNVSEFGYIANTQNIQNLSDIEVQCHTCDFENVLSEPLENTTQVPSQQYVTLLSDCNDNKCFNLSILHPLKKIEIKTEKDLKSIYFTDNFNPPRYIQLNNLEIYSYDGEEVCGDDSGVIPTCLACDKMRIFRQFDIPNLSPETIVLGGRLLPGTYEFLVAYSDNLGNEISEYYSITNPITIFDDNNVVSPVFDQRTNYAIKLDVSGLDKNYAYYKVAVIQTNINQETSYYIEGIHSVNDNSILYTTEQGKSRTELPNILRSNIHVERWSGLTQSNGYLFGYGITVAKEVNLQPVVNLMGSFLRWQTHIAKENLYQDGIANSKYKGYHRDETYPFGIRFFMDGGYTTAIFPFIGRPATNTDRHALAENKDKESIQYINDSCVESGITERWQLYNTASLIGVCELSFDVPTTTITEDVTKTCYIPNVAVAPAGEFVISLSQGQSYSNLYDFIEENRDNCIDYPFCDYLEPGSYPGTCTPIFENCSTPVLQEESMEVTFVENEVAEKIERNFPEEYAKIRTPRYCNLYTNDSQSGGYMHDEDFEKTYMTFNYNPISKVFNWKDVYVRPYNFSNEACLYADDLLNIQDPNLDVTSYFHMYKGADTMGELQTEKASLFVGGDFAEAKISKSALWFKGNVSGRDRFIIEISKQNNPSGDDDISAGQEIRFDFFNKCANGTALFSEIVDLEVGVQYYVTMTSTGFTIENSNTGDVETVAASFIDGEFFISLDIPIIESDPVVQDPTNPDIDFLTTRYRTAPTDGCFSIVTRDIEYKEIRVSYDEITFRKKMVYTASCDFEVPQVQDCEAIPYQYGKFGYTESVEEYPDNAELFDSTRLVIEQTDIPITYQEEFEDYFVNNNNAGTYALNLDTNFACKKIRHFKFPDNKVTPFMWENQQAPLVDSIIYPLGVTIDENLINSFLDIAVKNNLITQQVREKIVGYEIVRGDRTLDKGIVAKGMMFDLMKYTENGKDIHYSNYPFNDLGSDKLNLLPGRNEEIPHPFEGLANNNFTFHSPETDYNKLSLPNMLKVEGYMFGTSKGYFDEVKDHPRWTILGRDAKRLANTLAIAEVVAEIAIQAAQAASNAQVWTIAYGGTANGFGLSTGTPAFVASGVIAALGAVEGIISKAGRYRYQWLQTFRDLGTPRNFAYYYAAEGHYNYLQTLQEEGEEVRNLQIAKNIRPGRLSITNEVEGSRLEINNIDREDSVLISLGEGFEITYPTPYVEYDNGTIDFNTSSRTYESESNACKAGRSEELRKNVASMYVSLKNYLPGQYGTVGSIKWLTTGYRGDLTTPYSSCIGIFGGDVVISRHTLKRKIPLFATTAMGQATLTPFEYKFYSNIGREPRFYCDYEIDGSSDLSGTFFPDFDSNYAMDCLTGRNDFYIKPPSKFYLYYYGIPNFLVETEINTNYRTSEAEPKNSFYPFSGDFMEWTQERNVSIKERNKFIYNNVYSKTVTPANYRTLPVNFSADSFAKRYDSPNGVMYSLPDNSENDSYDPWLIYRPLDFYQFPTDYGKLIELRGIETTQVLGRFENQTAIFNAVDVLVDGITPAQRNLGSGGIFARRPVTFTQTDLGYAGSQTTDMVSCEHGHFFVDAKRGQVFSLAPGGKGIEEISSYTDGKPSGMSNWFKEHLPFKILRYIPDADVDNPYNGLGITMGWDSRYKRVFVTKRDYIPKGDTPLVACGGKILDVSGNEAIIDQYIADGYNYNGIIDCKLNFSREIANISDSTDIHAFFDVSGSFSGAGLQQVRDAMQNFYNNYVATHPTFTGTYYIHNNADERWVKFIETVAATYGGDVEDKDVLVVSFTNESNGAYHSGTFTTPLTPTQVTNYFTDYGIYQGLASQFNNVFSVAYPIITTGASGSGSPSVAAEGKALIVQTLLAMYGTAITETEFNTIPQNAVFTNPEWLQVKAILMGINPYNITGLYDLGWVGQFDVNDISGTVITDERLNDDLNAFISGGSTPSTETVEIEIPEVSLNNEDLFEDVSWTIAYSPIMAGWVSYYDFKPNYYISHHNYFQTGINAGGEEFGLWSHLLTNKSYQVFYGKKYPFVVEYPVKSDMITKQLNNVEIWSEAKRHHNSYDYAFTPLITFNKATVYNNVGNSGNLNLIPQKNNLVGNRNYPKTNGDNTQDILISNVDNFKWSFDYIFNRVKTNLVNQPNWFWDKNQINKTINPHAVGFRGKRVLDKLAGDYFINKITYDTDSRFDLILKWGIAGTQV